MNEDTFLTDYFNDCAQLILTTDVTQSCVDAKKMFLNSKLLGGKLIFAGNGASASIANHASLDFTKQAKVRSVNFNESALITAFANDFGYANGLQKAVEFYADTEDTLVLISSSGSSLNVINAAMYAKKNNINVVTFSGFEATNPLSQLGDINFWIDSKAYNIIESIHQLWLLSICDLIIGKKEYSVS